jgi:50S ribosomal subunit-associated GTPase HflX
MNKIDLLESKQREALRDDERTVHVSAVRGVGIATLLERIDQLLEEDPVSRVRLSIPQKEGKLLAMLAAQSRIYSREYRDGVVELEAEAPESVVRRVREFVVKTSS